MSEREIWTDFFYSTGGGVYWNYTNWLNDDVCSWGGIVCDATKHAGGFMCTGRSCPQRGKLPESLCSLSPFVSLQIENSHLFGPLPDCYKNVERQLILPWANLSGPLPNFSNPIKLDVKGNHFTSLPQSVLSWFDASYNEISGRIPASLAAFPGLTFLSLEYNNMSGNLPQIWSKNLTNLKLAHNKFSGSITQRFDAFLLQTIDLSYNLLEGQLPEDLFKGTPILYDIKFANNGFSGLFPASLELLHACARLAIQNNFFSGALPKSHCAVYDLANNSLTAFPVVVVNETQRAVGMWLDNNPIRLPERCVTHWPKVLPLSTLSMANVALNMDVRDVMICLMKMVEKLTFLNLTNASLLGNWDFNAKKGFFLELTILDVSQNENLVFDNSWVNVQQSFPSLNYFSIIGCNITEPFQVTQNQAAVMRFNPLATFIDPTTLYQCQQISVSLDEMKTYIFIDAFWFHYETCVCPVGTCWSTQNSKCLALNQNVRCNNESRPVILAGYYPLNANNTLPSLEQDASRVVRCRKPNAAERCNPQLTFPFSCGQGFDPYSLLCSQCADGFYLTGSECVMCPDKILSWLVLVAQFAMFLLFLGYVMFKKKFGETGSCLSILFFFFQINGFLEEVGITRSLPAASSSFSLTNLRLEVGNCILKPNYERAFYIVVIAGLVLQLLCVLSWLCKTRGTKVSWYLMDLMYFPIAKTTISGLWCIQDETVYYLFAEPNISCSGSTFETIRILSWVSLAFVIALHPFLTLRRMKRGEEFISSPFRLNEFYFLPKIRQLPLALLLATLDSWDSTAGVWLLCVLLCSGLLHVKWQPYKKQKDEQGFGFDNSLEAASLVLTSFNICVSSTFDSIWVSYGFYGVAAGMTAFAVYGIVRGTKPQNGEADFTAVLLRRSTSYEG